MGMYKFYNQYNQIVLEIKALTLFNYIVVKTQEKAFFQHNRILSMGPQRKSTTLISNLSLLSTSQ